MCLQKKHFGIVSVHPVRTSVPLAGASLLPTAAAVYLQEIRNEKEQCQVGVLTFEVFLELYV